MRIIFKDNERSFHSLFLPYKNSPNKIIVKVKRQMEIRCHFTFTRTGYNYIDMKQQVLLRMWRNWNPHTLLVRVYNGTAALAIPQMLKHSIIVLSSNSFPGIYPRKMRAYAHTKLEHKNSQ